MRHTRRALEFGRDCLRHGLELGPAVHRTAHHHGGASARARLAARDTYADEMLALLFEALEPAARGVEIRITTVDDRVAVVEKR